MIHTLAFLPNIGPTELIIVLVLVLLIFGPKNIPKLAKMLGRGVREFKDASSKMTDSWLDDDEDDKKERRNRSSAPREQEPREELIDEREKKKDTNSSSREHENIH